MSSQDFSIITPCLNGGRFIRRNIKSIADQSNVTVEHIIQDGGSTDDSVEAAREYGFSVIYEEPDRGMYDAVNKGLKKSSGQYLAYLNADEQYLPGVLENVKSYFEAHPDVDVIIGDVLIVDTIGNLLSYRRCVSPKKMHTLVSHLGTLTASTFFRRGVIEEHGNYFDADWKCAGDAEWMVRVLNAKLVIKELRKVTSIFMDTGNNLGASETAQLEAHKLSQEAPGWARALKPLLIFHHRIRKLLAGAYRIGPISYSVYLNGSDEKRSTITSKRPPLVWKK